MKDLVQLTGGTVVQIDTFANVVFKESLKRVFAKEDEDGFLGSSSCATLEVLPSRDIKVAGLLGPACRVDKKGPHVADTEVGQGGTTQWKMCGVDADASVAVFFEITGGGPGQQQEGQVGARRVWGAGTGGCGWVVQGGGCGGGGGERCSPDQKKPAHRQGQQLFIQFITRYLHWTGALRCRVTTLTRFWTDGANTADLLGGFDQEAAAVVRARGGLGWGWGACVSSP